MGKNKGKAIKVVTDQIAAKYKATALKAVQGIPVNKTLKEQTYHVSNFLDGSHPEIEWGILLEKDFSGTTFMLYSYAAS
jgi:hypothetical protein